MKLEIMINGRWSKAVKYDDMIATIEKALASVPADMQEPSDILARTAFDH